MERDSEKWFSAECSVSQSSRWRDVRVMCREQDTLQMLYVE